MYCRNCGAKIADEGARFCPECGTAVRNDVPSGTDNVQKRNYNGNNYNGNDYNSNNHSGSNRNGNNNMLAFIALAAVMAVIICALIVFIIVKASGGKQTEENNNNGAVVLFTAAPTATPTPTPVPTATPTPTPVSAPASDHAPAPVSNPASAPEPPRTVTWEEAVNSRTISEVSGGYKRYTNTAYNFSCLFPAGFEVFNDGTKSLWSVRSSDGGVVTISASAATDSVSDGKQRYISQKGGTIDYQNSGSNFYAVRLADGGKYHYKYCKYANGNMYWFEVDFPGSSYSRYDTIINDMYQSLTY
jgi:hypothetical protein